MEEHEQDLATPGGMSRQQFLTRASAGVLGATVVGGLGARGALAAAAAAPKPKRGGTLRCGFGGGSATDTCDGDNVINNMDFARTYQLYDGLVGDVDLVRARLRAPLVQDSLRLRRELRVAVEDRDSPAVARELVGDGRADTPARAGDHADGPVQLGGVAHGARL